jgi:hypothetical protein
MTTKDTETRDDAEAEAALTSGYDHDPNAPTETPAEGTTGASAEDEAPAVKYAQITEDEYATLKARAELIEQIKATQEKSLGTAFGKIGGLERQLKSFSEGKQVQIKPESIAAVRDISPEFADALEQLNGMRSIAGGPAEIDESRIDALVQQRMAPALQKVELRLLAKDHPDWQQVDKDPKFAEWIAAQPAAFQTQLLQASQTYDSEAVSAAMSAFKQARSKTAPVVDTAAQRKARIAAAVTPRGAGGIAAPNQLDDLMAGFNE